LCACAPMCVCKEKPPSQFLVLLRQPKKLVISSGPETFSALLITNSAPTL